MSETQKKFYSVSVGEFGHHLLKGARHWSILVEMGPPQFTAPARNALIYQVSGSTETYEYSKPLLLDLKQDKTFLAHIPVGYIRLDQAEETDTMKEDEVKANVDAILSEVPITRGSSQWNCQNWVVAGLQVLADAVFDIKTYSQQEMLQMFKDAEN
jgi:hypothetical protein